MTGMPELPDVVLSGINYGYNVAGDIQYSATAAAAFEGEFLGCRAIAFSEDAAPCHEVTDAYLKHILGELIDTAAGPGRIWNVNFPSCPLSECRGILRDRLVSPLAYFKDRYHEQPLEDGGIRLTVEGYANEGAEEGTDFLAVINQYVSVGSVRNIS